MERQSTSKLFKVVIAVVAFFLLCTSAVLFASCGTSREECEHEWDPTPILTAEATCGTPGFVVYECKICGEECKLEYSLATGQHTFNENNVCTTCGMTQSQADLLNTATFNAALTEVKEALSKLATEDSVKKLNNLSEAQVKTLVEAAQKALNGDITSAKQAVLDALNGENGLSASLSKAVTDAQTALNSKIEEALTKLTALDTKTASKSEIEQAVADAQSKIESAITAAQNALGGKIDALTQNSSPLMQQLGAIMGQFTSTDGNAFGNIIQALSQLSTNLETLGGTVDGIDGTLGTLNGKISTDLSSNVAAIKEYIDQTLKAAIGEIQTNASALNSQLLNGTTGIFAKLQAAQDAINAKVAEYGNKQLTAAQVKQAVSELLNGQGGAEGGLSKTLTDAVDAAKKELAGKIDKVLTSQKFETAMTTVNSKLDDITTAVTDTLSQQITNVETNLTALLNALDGAINKPNGDLPTIKGWIDDLKKAILGDEEAVMSDASAGSLPNGMQKQIANIWEIVDAMEKTLNGVATKGEYDQKFENLNTYLQQQAAALAGQYTALDEAINGKAGAEGKKTGGLVQSLEALSGTLDTIDGKLDAMDTTLQEVLSNTKFFKEMFGKLKTEVDKAIQEMGMNNWRDVLTKAADYYKSFSKYADNADYYLGQINDWADIAKAVVNWVKDQGFEYDVNGNITDLGNFQKAIDTAKATWDFFGLDKTNGYTKELPMTLVQMQLALENAQYMDFGKADHVHNWDLVLVGKYNCLTDNTYEWQCTICGKKQADVFTDTKYEIGQVTKPATGHVIDWTYYKDGKNAVEEEVHYYAATCITPARVEGYCVNCKQPVGEWTTYGEATGNHVYVLENGTQADGKPYPEFADHKCTSVHSYVYHCITCGGAYTETVEDGEGEGDPDPADPTHPTPHDYYSQGTVGEDGKFIPNGKPLTPAQKLEKYLAYAQSNSITPTGWTSDAIDAANEKDEKGEGDTQELRNLLKAAEQQLTPVQRYEALKDNLNIVYQSEKTCIDPSLVVVECVYCGVRYAYSFGEPHGHKLQRIITPATGVNTCTTDTLKDVYYCTDCQYYFMFLDDQGNPIPQANMKDDEGKWSDTYKFSTAYLRNTGAYKQYAGGDPNAVINGDPGTNPTYGTNAYMAAYYACATKALGHTFEGWLHAVDNTCTTPGRWFQICSKCGLIIDKDTNKPQDYDDGQNGVGAQLSSLVGGHLKADPNYVKAEGGAAFNETELDAIFNGKAENAGAFKKEGSESSVETLYPDYIKNLKRMADEEGINAVIAQLTKQGYFWAIEAPQNVKSVDELINKYITGLNISFINIDQDVDGHDFVPVYTNISNCVTAQQYTLVCRNCYTEGNKTLAELCKEEDSGWVYDPAKDVYYAPEYTKVENSYDVVNPHTFNTSASDEGTFLAASWNKFFKEGGDELAEGVTEMDVWLWLCAKNYTKRDLINGAHNIVPDFVEDTDDGFQLKEGVTVAQLKALYTGNNLIEGLELPVAGHTFTPESVVTTVVGNCVMYQRTVWFCSICGQETVDPNPATAHEDVYSYSPDSDLYIGAHHTGEETVETTDLTKSWEAVYNKGEGKVDDILAWLAQYGYLNNRLPVGVALSTPAARIDFEAVKTANEDWYTALKTALEAALKAEDDGVSLAEFFSGTNQLAEYTVTADETGKPITLGHTFEAVWIKTADCEGAGAYVYVCTKCGEHTSEESLTWTIAGEGDYTAENIKRVVGFKGSTEDNAQIKQSPSCKGEHTDKTDLALEFAALEGTNNQLEWLAKHGYLNTVRDTKMKVGTAEYVATAQAPSWAEVVLETTNILSAYKEANPDVETSLEDLVAQLFTAKNETSELIATAITAQQHLWSVDPNNAKCKGFADEQLTKWFRDGYTATWNAAEEKWEQGPKYNMDLFTDGIGREEDVAWYKAAMENGIVGACMRDNCPQHADGGEDGKTGESAYTKTKDGMPYTAGYVAAKPHEMVYRKFNANSTGTFAGEPSTTYDETAEYNMKKVEAYMTEAVAGKYLAPETKWADADADTQKAAAQKAMDADPENLYTLQKLWYSYKLAEFIDPATGLYKADSKIAYDADSKLYKDAAGLIYPAEDQLYPVDGELAGKAKDYGLDAWRPLTNDLKPSCWVALFCKYYRTEGNAVDGYKCNEAGKTNDHVFPKDNYWDYQSLAPNCNHGLKCYTCGHMTGAIGEHNLQEVGTLSGTNLTAWESLFAAYKKTSAYTDKYEQDYEWQTLLNPTCCEPGYHVYICTGQLEEVTAEQKPNWVPCTAEYKPGEPHVHSEGANYCLEKLEPTGAHEFTIHYLVATSAKFRGQELFVSENQPEWFRDKDHDGKYDKNYLWNDGHNQFVCLYGIEEYWVCHNARRDGSPCYENRLIITMPATMHHLAPVKDYWLVPDKYTPATESSNARIQQVCTICGETFYEEYGATTSGNSEDSKEQYALANEFEVKLWNAIGKNDPALGKAEKTLAREEGIRPEDRIKETGVTGSLDGVKSNVVYNTGNYQYDEGGEVTFAKRADVVGKEGQDAKGNALVPAGAKSIIQIGEGKKLTFKANSGDVGALNLFVAGDLTIRGGTVDISDLNMIGVSGKLTLENVTVECGNNGCLFPYNGGEIVVNGGKIIGGKYAPIETNNVESVGGCKITLNNTTVISDAEGECDGVALLINNPTIILTATDTTFYGKNIGAAVKSGTANFTNCKFYTNESGTAGSAWGQRVSMPVHAALEVGNGGEAEYGDAAVTLTNCTFGYATYDSVKQELTPAPTTEWKEGCKALSMNATANDKASVTVNDQATCASLGDSIDGKENANVSYTVNLANDVNVTAEQVAELLASSATDGGTIVLPEGDKEYKVESLNVKDDLTIKLNGNTLNTEKAGIVVANGKSLEITDGDVTGCPGKKQETATVNNTIIAVLENGSLKLDKVTITVADFASDKNDGMRSTYCVYGAANSTITISNSTLTSVYGPAIGTNGNEAPAKMVLTDSAFISDVDETVDAELDYSTSVGLMMNNTIDELYAGGCLFYGTNAAAWIRGGKAMFAGCTFATKGFEREKNTGWGTGAGLAKKATAALVVGNGGYSDNYGNAEVEIIDGTIKFVDYKSAEGVAKTALLSFTEDQMKHNGTQWNVTGGDATTGKGMTIAAYNQSTTKVTFSDEDTAKLFLGADEAGVKKPVVGENLFLEGTAQLSQVELKWMEQKYTEESKPDGDPIPHPIYVEKKATDASAAADVLAAAQNGGKVTFDETVTEVKPAAGLSVPAGKEVDIELTDKQSLNLEANDIKVAGGSSLTISGGKLTNTDAAGDTLVKVTGNKGSVTLKDVELETTETYGVAVAPDVTDAIVTITNTKVVANDSALSVNGLSNATLVLKDSTFFGNNGIGNYFAGKATVTATNCVFYGSVSAAEVVSGEYTFVDCTFISGGDMTGFAANKQFGDGKFGMPGEYAGNLSIVAKVGYQRPVSVTLKGKTQWVSVNTNAGEVWRSEDVFAAEQEGEKTASFTDALGTTYYYKPAKVAYQRVTVSIVAADYVTAETARVTLKTEGTQNALSLVVNTNVWIFTKNTDTDNSKVATPDFAGVQNVLKIAEGSNSTLANQD